ncbi:hypothetical protein EJ03DRAFT_104760 [Teratosphaeria nubilosa]|uniref:Uncharacterized protein n=1 Tax=Teratosphaeria nubilosa TaxID=161662 RepID=A0A6G1LL99_9PEZI|nr:hypothetical protein EJ03DRAFT_104760 [Teratosphaeria nubilosa]
MWHLLLIRSKDPLSFGIAAEGRHERLASGKSERVLVWRSSRSYTSLLEQLDQAFPHGITGGRRLLAKLDTSRYCPVLATCATLVVYS